MNIESNESTKISVSDIPPSARALTSLGDSTTRAIYELFTDSQGSLFPTEDNPDFQDLSESFRKRHWSDADAAELIRAYRKVRESNRNVEVKSIIRWILAHDDHAPAQAVIECMEIEPPKEIDIIKVLSRKGSQKIVFLASWRLQQQEVVLKKVIGNSDSVQRVLSRELQPHPLNMVHPNIIETHVLRNDSGESFLVEKKLPVVLSDEWRANGIHEAANLLFDIAQAIKFLHEHGLVHGDIKPDNIGKREDRYVLLDFGICRPSAEFTKESTPTGSIRTRAVELLGSKGYIDPPKVDIWALGATVFNSLVGRFPLVAVDEAIPRISSPVERRKFEREVAKRASKAWDHWVKLDSIADPLRQIIEKMLTLDVGNRIDAANLVKLAEKELSAFIPSSSPGTARFSPIEEFQQIREYLSHARTKLIPPIRKQRLRSRLNDLKSVHGFDPDSNILIDELVASLT